MQQRCFVGGDVRRNCGADEFPAGWKCEGAGRGVTHGAQDYVCTKKIARAAEGDVAGQREAFSSERLKVQFTAPLKPVATNRSDLYVVFVNPGKAD